MSIQIVILAAGKGTRMYSQRPKVLHPLAGKALIAHVIDTVSHLQQPIHRCCVVIGHEAAQIRAAFVNHPEPLVWVDQTEQLGTGHAVLQTLPFLSSEQLVLILYGDVPLIQPETLNHLIHQAEKNHFALLTAQLSDPTGYGRIIRNKNGQVTSIVEQRDATPEQLMITEINTGIMVVKGAYLNKWLPQLKNENQQQEYYLTDIIECAVNDGLEIATHSPRNLWEIMGVNNKIQLLELERIFQKNQALDLLAQGVTLHDANRIDIRGHLTCGQDVEIDINCIFEGHVTLGNHVKIGAGCLLKNVTIGEHTTIKPYSILEGAEIQTYCEIGPYSRVRPGTKLENAVHLGNFVEVKNSTISKASKANHLSYIGDAQIGKNVNIGAGTITCNYDGAKKHLTRIEDDVFVGSDTQLVAPVTVKKGVTIAAGTTVTKETPENALILSRVKQSHIANWKRPQKNNK